MGGQPQVTGIVLAAGASARMGSPKATLAWCGETFVAIACRRLRTAGVTRTIVVVGPPHERAVSAAVAEIEACVVVRNPHPEDGQLASLRRGIEAVGETDAVLVALVDHPAVRGATFRAVLSEFAASGGPIVQPRHAGRGGHPVLVARALFAEVLAAPLAGGLRGVIVRDSARVRTIAVDDPGIVLDVDDPIAYRALVRGAPPPD